MFGDAFTRLTTVRVCEFFTNLKTIKEGMLKTLSHDGTRYTAYPKALWERHVTFTRIGRVGALASFPLSLAVDLVFFKGQGMFVWELFTGGAATYVCICARDKYSPLGDQVPVALPKDIFSSQEADKDVVWIGSCEKKQ